MSDLSERIRAAISDSYYDARNDGLTMEHAADQATAKVLAIITEHPESEGWVPFGTHANCRNTFMEFSDELGEDGLPVWERVTVRLENDDENLRTWRADRDAELRKIAHEVAEEVLGEDQAVLYVVEKTDG